MHFLLFYEKVSDFENRQPPFQASHREHVHQAAAAGSLLLAGSLGTPNDGAAVLLFESPTSAVAENFAATDPYVIHGIIARWWIRSWDIVAGTSVETKFGEPRNF